MKFKLLGIAALLAATLFGTAAYASASFLTLHKHQHSSMAMASSSGVVIDVYGDSSIPDSTPLHAEISGYAIASGMQIPLDAQSTTISQDYGTEAYISLSDAQQYGISKLELELHTASGAMIPGCVASLQSASGAFSTPMSKVMTVSKTSSGYHCTVH